jgi:hypothetical protein
MRLHRGLGSSFALAVALALPWACSGSGASGGDGGADATTEGGDDAAEPLICTEFTEAGAPCSTPSPVRCFAECEAGGCSCTATPQGPRWSCHSDQSCMADCAPLDDGCGPPMGDDGGDEGIGDDGGGDAGGDAAGEAAGDGAGDAPGDVGPGDAGDASG